ncbi:L-threonylcarbamoyladenylate synthase [Vagococcus lutrae]|uniref:Threonylcarbamoyl-AMP synthase n=1 Tax=Vagococcus lutrae TaxID=81947 RepID=A0AAE9XDU8_9ENTE|nr:L-threonylcarbamoyladenylate synthase [Vagococcus lutrae]WCG22303.1 L-threonylcarbamoyladenylate synthase [Vagococcus lutrae]GEQ60704.1 translation factor Sua5 [Vagococcus lutrae]GEQ62598.1 translation factor Sua5 [Vagococcus lutrae]GEQ64624.1 translation factor Sua5 [Vagococcus lutrae]
MSVKWDKSQLVVAAEALRAGKLVAFPTETVYGLGADATNPSAVKSVYTAKGRPSDNPLIVHIASPEEVLHYTESIPPVASLLMKEFWPGPLTLIFKLKPNALGKEVTGGMETVAFRMPDNEVTLALIEATGRPLVGPSANTSGKPSPTTAEHVLHDLQGKIAGVVDDGATRVGVESTVLDLSSDVPTILRPGAITLEMLKPLVPEVVEDTHLKNQEAAPKAPGMKYKHYAPDTQVVMVASEDWPSVKEWLQTTPLNVGLLATASIYESLDKNKIVWFSLGNRGSVSTALSHLYAGLRDLDEIEPKLDVILAETMPEEHEGVAYMNRLKKAANYQYFNEWSQENEKI